MKTIAIWSGVAFLAFVIMAVQMGLSHRQSKADASPNTQEPAAAKDVPHFPDDLAPAAQAKAVPAAAEYKASSDPHPLVFLRLNGDVHAWQEHVRDDWQADTVGSTQLVVVLGVPTKTKVSYH